MVVESAAASAGLRCAANGATSTVPSTVTPLRAPQKAQRTDVVALQMAVVECAIASASEKKKRPQLTEHGHAWCHVHKQKLNGPEDVH
jgi:hypothetical protein